MPLYAEFAEYYEAIFPFSETVYSFLRRFLTVAGTRCLDIGCGTGHYAGRLAADGFTTVGIDLDAAMIAYAKQHYPNATFHCMNMLDIAGLGESFDTIYCIGNTAAHLTQVQFARFLKTVNHILSPGGSWILQVMNWDYVLTQAHVTFPPLEAKQEPVTFLREYRDVSEQAVIFHTRLKSGAQLLFEGNVSLYPLRSDQYLRLHEQVGFKCVGHFADYAGHSFDPDVFSAQVFVFRK